LREDAQARVFQEAQMRKIRNLATTIFVAPLAALTMCGTFALPVRAQATPAASTDKPVIVELFTSEGCSDCPPAEALAMQMEKEPLPGIDMIVLEEHVTYWNQYGWFDPFSSSDWTARQMEYVGKTPKPNPYTPEMVVDGGAQFVGSDGKQAQAAIETAAHAPDTPVTITEDKADAKGAGDFKISVGKLEGSTPGDEADVWIAVTEDGLHSAPNAGENSGHTLYHAAVLRYLHEVGPAQANGFSGEARVKINSKWDRKDVNVVAFVQDRKSLKIIGAASMNLGS
jgi:hypothetical protein